MAVVDVGFYGAIKTHGGGFWKGDWVKACGYLRQRDLLIMVDKGKGKGKYRGGRGE